LGYTVKGRRGKEKKSEEEALVVVPLSSCRRRPAGPIIEDRGGPHVITLLQLWQ
jgi:hypothetical protein